MFILSAYWLKYLPFVLIGLGFVLAVHYIFKEEHLLKFFTDSMKTDGKPDSKKLSGFALVITLISGFFIAIYYAEHHVPPEYYVWIIAGLIASFYGIREVGRFVTAKFGGGDLPPQNVVQEPSTPPPPVQPPPSVVKKDDKKEDIG